jgi:hypothetical protein
VVSADVTAWLNSFAVPSLWRLWCWPHDLRLFLKEQIVWVSCINCSMFWARNSKDWEVRKMKQRLRQQPSLFWGEFFTGTSVSTCMQKVDRHGREFKKYRMRC